MKSKNVKLAIIISILFLFTGCINVNRSFKEVRDNILSNFDETFKKEYEFAIGPTAMHLASSFVQFDEDAEDQDIGLMLRQLNRIQIGVYKRNNSDSFDKYKTNNLQNHLKKEKWQRIVISKEIDRVSEIFIKQNDEEELKQMLIVNAELDEMIIVELSGDLDELIAVAIANNGLDIAVKK